MSQIELILSRHGETEENKLHIMQGQLPGHLSELGKQQAKALAETLDKEKLDVIVCSDLARGYDTAMAVARQKGLQPVATPLLREMDWGIYTGKVGDEMDFTTLPESVETIEALYKRAGDFVDFLKKEFPGKRILAIGHGGFNRSRLSIMARLSTRTSASFSTSRPFWKAFSMIKPIPSSLAPDCFTRSSTPIAALPYARKSSIKRIRSSAVRKLLLIHTV